VEPRNIVFLSRSIFVEGVVSRLQQHSQKGEIHFIDPGSQNYIDQVSELHPAVIVLDADQFQGSRSYCLCDLLNAFPAITIIRLKIQEKDIQVITSAPHVLENVKDLIDLININVKEGGKR
jgi:hypothetical protein